MSFNWNDFLVLAEELGKDRASDSKMRSSISRAYYSSFHNAKNFLVNKKQVNFSRGSMESHKQVWDKFKEFDTDEAMRRIAINGSRIKDNRVAADYDATKSQAKLIAIMHDTLAFAKKIKSDLETLNAK